MTSTNQIHEIINWCGMANKPELMQKLKALRLQVADETKKAVLKEFNFTQGKIRTNFNLLKNHYQNGT